MTTLLWLTIALPLVGAAVLHDGRAAIGADDRRRDREFLRVPEFVCRHQHGTGGPESFERFAHAELRRGSEPLHGALRQVLAHRVAGYMRGSRIERIYREVRVNAIGGGSEEIMRDLAARQMGI